MLQQLSQGSSQRQCHCQPRCQRPRPCHGRFSASSNQFPIEQLATFLVDPDPQQKEPAESSFLVDEVAQGMTPVHLQRMSGSVHANSQRWTKRDVWNDPACMESSHAAQPDFEFRSIKVKQCSSSHPSAINARLADIANGA